MILVLFGLFNEINEKWLRFVGEDVGSKLGMSLGESDGLVDVGTVDGPNESVDNIV